MLIALLLWGFAWTTFVLVAPHFLVHMKLPSYLLFEILCLAPFTLWLVERAVRAGGAAALSIATLNVLVLAATYLIYSGALPGTRLDHWDLFSNDYSSGVLLGIRIGVVPIEEFLFWPLLANMGMLLYLWGKELFLVEKNRRSTPALQLNILFRNIMPQRELLFARFQPRMSVLDIAAKITVVVVLLGFLFLFSRFDGFRVGASYAWPLGMYVFAAVAVATAFLEVMTIAHHDVRSRFRIPLILFPILVTALMLFPVSVISDSIGVFALIVVLVTTIFLSVMTTELDVRPAFLVALILFSVLVIADSYWLAQFSWQGSGLASRVPLSFSTTPNYALSIPFLGLLILVFLPSLVYEGAYATASMLGVRTGSPFQITSASSMKASPVVVELIARTGGTMLMLVLICCFFVFDGLPMGRFSQSEWAVFGVVGGLVGAVLLCGYAFFTESGGWSKGLLCLAGFILLYEVRIVLPLTGMFGQ